MNKFNGIGLELIGNCNARCEFCTWGNKQEIIMTNVRTKEKHIRSKKKIDKQLIDDMLDYHPISNIITTGISEPLLAKDRLFYLLEKEQIKALTIYSNGVYLDEQTALKLLSYPNFKRINISLNANTDDVRMKVMKLPLKQTEDNLINFLNLRDDEGRTKDVNVGISYILTPNNNWSKENDFRRDWGTILGNYENTADVGCFFASNWNGDVPENVYWMRTSGNESICRQWRSQSPTISCDGQIYLCCYSTKWSFGHVLDQESVDHFFNRQAFYKVDDSFPGGFPFLCKDCSLIGGVNWK